MYIAYLRRSTNRQVNSSERQRVEIEKYAKQNGIVIDRYYEEMPISGSTPVSQRPALTEALFELGKGDSLVVADLTRLSRSQSHTSMILALINQKGAGIKFADNHTFDDRDMVSVLMTNILSFCAQLERENIRLRVKQGMAVAKQTKAMGSPKTVKFGWRNVGGVKQPHGLEQEIGVFVKNARVKGMKLKDIQSELCKRGWVNRNGNPFSVHSISHLHRTFCEAR
jgi:DNA invertase Pin-like site-specific DNA recombinase